MQEALQVAGRLVVTMQGDRHGRLCAALTYPFDTGSPVPLRKVGRCVARQRCGQVLESRRQQD
jgi:hypothetical protein